MAETTEIAEALTLVEQVRAMLNREAYHYCADCKGHCRQTILAVEALKELFLLPIYSASPSARIAAAHSPASYSCNEKLDFPRIE